jgi:integrase
MGEMNTTNTERTLVGARMTIYPRGKRRVYHADYHHNGRHCRKSLDTTIKKVAMRRATILEQSLDGESVQVKAPAVPKTSRTITLTAASKEFVSFSETEGRRRKTVVKQRGILHRFVEFSNENQVRELADVDMRLVDKYRAFRKDSLSPKSMHNEGQLLKQFLGWCAERQLITHNPLADRKFTPPRPMPRGGPTLEQIDDILDAASDVRCPVIVVAAFAGMRIGEVVRLRVEDVDFTGNWLHVVSRPGFETKSGDNWKVPIHPRLRKMLESFPHRASGWFFTAQPSRKFPLGDHHINPKKANEDFIKVLESLGIAAGRDGEFTFHSLRSSFKTICINAGVPKEVVDVWQNHAPDRAASHVYYKLTDSESQRFMLTVPFGE